MAKVKSSGVFSSGYRCHENPESLYRVGSIYSWSCVAGSHSIQFAPLYASNTAWVESLNVDLCHNSGRDRRLAQVDPARTRW